MGFGFSFAGSSGKEYQYVQLDMTNAGALPLQSGCFVIARSGHEPEPIRIGHADSIYSVFTTSEIWNAARTEHGANCVFVHWGPKDQASRQAEVDDLVANYKPVMNLPPQAIR